MSPHNPIGLVDVDDEEIPSRHVSVTEASAFVEKLKKKWYAFSFFEGVQRYKVSAMVKGAKSHVARAKVTSRIQKKNGSAASAGV